jgi:hypothetical protein
MKNLALKVISAVILLFAILLNGWLFFVIFYGFIHDSFLLLSMVLIPEIVLMGFLGMILLTFWRKKELSRLMVISLVANIFIAVISVVAFYLAFTNGRLMGNIFGGAESFYTAFAYSYILTMILFTLSGIAYLIGYIKTK